MGKPRCPSLNSALTVNQGWAGSHIKHWATFSELLVRFISDNENVPPVVFLFWGNHAKYFAKFINKKKHYIISGGHPSTLCGMRVNNFFGGGYVLCANEFLGSERGVQIDWGLAEENWMKPCPKKPKSQGKKGQRKRPIGYCASI